MTDHLSPERFRSNLISQIGDRLFSGIRFAPGAGKNDDSDPWNVNEWQFPADAPIRDQLLFLIKFAVLAPSVLNRQPWKFKVVDNHLLLYADTDKALPAFDPQRRELTMSCGAALFHIRVAAIHYGYSPVVRSFPTMNDPDLLAEFTLGNRLAPGALDEQLFMAIRGRRTHRQEFEDRSVEQAALTGLKNAAFIEGCDLTFVDGPARESVAASIGEAQRRLDQDPSYRIEVSESNISAIGTVEKKQRLLSFGDYISDVPDPGLPARKAPALGILSTRTDTVPSWFQAGQAIDRILLTAREYGLFASFMNQPMHFPDTRDAIAAVVRQPVAQLVLRIGYGSTPKPTPRTPAEQVIT